MARRRRRPAARLLVRLAKLGIVAALGHAWLRASEAQAARRTARRLAGR